MSPLKTAAEGIKKFATIVEEREISKKQSEIVKLIKGPISNVREKLQLLDTEEASSLLAQTGCTVRFGQNIKDNVLDIFDEEVSNATKILKEVDATIYNLQEVLEDISYRMVNDRKEDEKSENGLVTDCYEHCRSVLIFYRLKSKILKHYLLTPADVILSSDPFSHCPDLMDEEENVTFVLCKIQCANFD